MCCVVICSNQLLVSSVDPSESEKRQREKTKSKVDAKRDASTLALQETLKGFLTQKEVSVEKREEMKMQEKEDSLNTFFDIQKKKLEIDETTNA
jgi:hypothetical protein